MTRQAIIQHTVNIISQLPEEKAEAISEFADFIMKRYEDHQLTQGIQQLTAEGDSFRFLEEDEEIYTEKDLKVTFNA